MSRFYLLARRGEYMGGHRLYMEIIKSHKCVRCRPARSSTNICYRGTNAQEEVTLLFPNCESRAPSVTFVKMREDRDNQNGRTSEVEQRALTSLVEQVGPAALS